MADSIPSFTCYTISPTAPASPPGQVEAMVVSPTQIRVTWNVVPNIDRNGMITLYEIEYTPLMDFGGQIGTQMVEVSVENLFVTLGNLEEFVEYNISVRAHTLAGPGPYSNGTIARTQETSKRVVV